MKKLISFCLLCLCAVWAMAQNYVLKTDIPYVDEGEKDAYRLERCKLDFYYPEGQKNFPTIVWFHGGGLEGGQKEIPQYFKENGFGVIGVNYRLYPKVKNPGYIEDAAQAVAWALKHVEEYGGNKERVYVSGHSAGGYLSLILATDKKWVAAYGEDCDKIRTYLPISGQTVTHFTIRKERGLPNGIPIIDEYAPVNKTRKDTAPIYLITGGRMLEMADRWEENALFLSVSRNIGNPNVTLNELEGFDHNTVLGPATLKIVEYVKKDNPELNPPYMVKVPGTEAFTAYRPQQQQGKRNPFGPISNMVPTFLVFADQAPANGSEALQIIDQLGLRQYYSEMGAGLVVAGPTDLEGYDKIFNALRVVGNLKVIGLGQGATFVNQVIAQHAEEVAGIFTYGGKPGSYSASAACPVPAFVAGTTAKQVGKLLIEQNQAKLTATEGKNQIYTNAEEPLQRVVISTEAFANEKAAMEAAWEQVLSKNYRFGNIGKTWYYGNERGKGGVYELEPTVWPGHAGVERIVKLIDIPGKDTQYLWYEYFPQGTGDAAHPAEKSIPLMILLHGNTNDPRTQAEMSGFIELATEEHFAVAELEWQGNGYEAMGLDGIEATIQQILQDHPQLDPSRVYAEGLSAGSFTASTLGIHSSHLFAAVGGHSGGLFPSGTNRSFGMNYDLLMKTALQKQGHVQMPYCSVCGTDDEVVVFPKEGNYEKSSIYWAWKMYQTFNNMPVAEKLDFQQDATFGQQLKNRQHVDTNKHISMEIGEQQDAAGIPLIKFVAVNKYAHWNFKPTARIMWDYYKHFSRDQKTGKLIYTK